MGIGLSQLPRMIKQSQALTALAGSPSLGGDDLDCNFIATIGYPEPLKTKDVEYVLSNLPTVEVMASKGPKKS